MATFFFAGIILFLSGAFFALVFSGTARVSRLLGYGFALAGSVSGLVFALNVLLTDARTEVSFLTLFSYPLFSFSIDALAAFFMLLVCGIGIAVSLFSFSYAEHYEKRYSTGLLGALYNLFLCSMLLVVAASNVIAFLVFWELMSLLSYFLVTYEHRKESARKAGLLYVVMTHLGTVFLTVAFFLLFRETGSFVFADFHGAGGNISALMRDIIFMLAFIGFGSKAGIVPFHIWLPEAHPAAPSHVSALMSGAMIKIAIYGIIRVVFYLLGGPMEWWWGVLVLVLGTVSALVGVLYALMQHDLKRLLAYSSVENIGIILIGVGSAMLFVASGHNEYAGIALFAGLFHTLNHALFKSLLFLGAGAVHNATGILNIEKLGGLAARMPLVAVSFLIGSMAISALPPLNGFASEWLVFQGLLGNLITLDSVATQVIVGLSVAFLALTGALALACFAKAFSITFLALPRSDQAANAKEPHWSMLAGMLLLAAPCIVLGVVPSLAAALAEPVTAELAVPFAVASDAMSLSLQNPGGFTHASIAPAWITLLFAGTVLMGMVFAAVAWGRHKKRKVPTWACGRHVEPSMEYTGSGLAMPFKLLFSGLYRPTQNIEQETLRGSTYLITSVKYREEITPLFEKYLYDPFVAAVVWVGDKMRKIQTGNLNMYLLYIFGTLIALLYLFV
ncbi:hydrogenase 4 subunit B [Candidatus Azambacteria bacterium RIFCSPHIGHO2_02_FULL_52_12]|uniref:Hydrogenase 4 subunit B n=1 Tax=Candidatus Azambacteria bacterium RIFCSPLOWO2_01_FULL_46_25 TaxID=1797298 RepID=A0A1F5BVQ5_9BACT|nr:MAG: hydrogenase 4 subunit B [Candidatus Azambacteria bacterium RIFCSPHIGHO2_02_FULL_52_12]OGD34680.1 MAG: hydrogenase 4 subunit B [Candidatus Azambacteria bacterium RIFCSPLOWO2_01_FULL_46_25]OGD37450.1 MAG: hydrogenase 4 subunit B [Candidatus Azambacteria bacterium RIFCSPHIGHO2_01_FULL_51_74]